MSAHSLARTFQHLLVILALASAHGSMAFAGELVTDESQRLRVLHLAFPAGQISIVPTQPRERPFPIEDPLRRVIGVLDNALNHGPDYEVIGPVAEDEEGAASYAGSPDTPLSNQRQVQMHLYRWRVREGAPLLVAILRYKFLHAHPPRCCGAVGKVLLLPSAADRILDVLNKTPWAFTMFTDVRFIPSTGTNPEMLMISLDFSGVATVGVSSAVFDVENARLKPLIAVDTVLLYEEGELDRIDVHTLTLDERQTHAAGGKQFVFTKKSFVGNGNVRPNPVTTQVSYPFGTGLPLDRNEAGWK